MENNNRRPNQQPPGAAGGGVGGGGEPAVMRTGDWRAHMHPDTRQRIVNKIMGTLQRHLPVSGQEGLQELRKIAVLFEEKIYSAATSQSDYLRRISLKMLRMEGKSQYNLPNPAYSSNPAYNSMQSQVPNQGQSLTISIPANQPQTRQQVLPQTIQNNIASAGAQSSAGLASAPPPVSGVTLAPISNVSGQNSVGISMSQGLSSNVFTNSQGQQIQGRQQVAQPQQQQTQNSQHQQQLQQELLKQNLQQGSIPQTLMQSHFQRQQNLFQPTQLQSSQQSDMQSSSVIQLSMMQPASVSGLQQNQQPSLQQSSQSMIHQQSVLRQQQQQQQQQAAVITQQRTSMSQQPTLPPQQQQPPLMGQQFSAGNMQQSQLIGQQNQLSGQQNSVGDMQQQQRFRGQQNNLSNVQQHQLMAQSRHQQQLASQNTVSGLSHQQQQPQLLGSQPNNSGMQTDYFGWTFALSNIILEALSAVSDELSSPNKPQFALVGLLTSFLALILCTSEFACKAYKAKVTTRRWGRVCWFSYPPPEDRPFGTFPDIFGFVSAVFQCAFSIIQYVYYRQHSENPIKISVLPLILAICVAGSRFLPTQPRAVTTTEVESVSSP